MQLHSLLDQGVTVITASRRLAHALRLDYARRAAARGQMAWRTPRVLPWSAWLRSHWIEARATAAAPRHDRLLTSAQASFIWSEVVAASEAGAQLLNPATAARLAQQSWLRMQQYLIPLEKIAATDSAEAQALHSWCREYQRRCESLGATDETLLPQWAHDSRFVPPHGERVALAGFDIIPPALERLLARWRMEGRVADISTPQRAAAQVIVTSASEAQTEIDLAARWARAQLADGAGSVGVLIGDLQRRRSEVRRIFEDVFAPGQRTLDPGSAAIPVTIAAPEPLASYPVVDGAMLVLEMALSERPSTHAGRLLRSPFIAGGDSERDQRALADLRLRHDQREKWDWFELERWAGVTGCQRLELAARAIGTLIRDDSAPAQPSRWVERFHRWLRAVDWPGERVRNSVEHQTVLKFNAALAEFGTLDAVSKAMSLRRALGRLQDLLRDTPFEPQSSATAVTVIDPGTAAGMTFDSIWVAGLDATRMPGPINPDALLPLDVQRAAGLPEASAEGTLQLARIRLQRWTRSAQKVTLSWSEQESEAALQPSPLLALLMGPQTTPLTFATPRPLRHSLFDGRPVLEEIVDDHAPPVHAGAASGGASILEYQSRCPFRAQAELRLHAQAVPRVAMGVEPMDRGNILHRVLADVWGVLGSHRGLIERDEGSLDELVRLAAERHVMHALRPTVRHRARLAQLEVELVTRQVRLLLQLEKARPPFTVRVAEAREAYEIGGLAIKIQPDRIDELEGGGQLLIDYKLGGSNSPRHWLDTRPGRPRRPQLPLYALAREHHLRALAFVVLAPGGVEYRGFSDGVQAGAGIVAYPGALKLSPESPSDFRGLLQHWRATLSALAEQFVAGQAEVDPLKSEECSHCHLTMLCRVREQAVAETESLSDE